MTAMMTIGEVARQVGVRPSAIRYYEQIGLLEPPARKHGRRAYGSEILDLLAIIRLARAAGLTLAETGTLLHGFADDTAPSVRWRAIATGKIEQVDAAIARLQTVRRALDQSLRCDCQTLASCAHRGWSDDNAPVGPNASPPTSGVANDAIERCRGKGAG